MTAYEEIIDIFALLPGTPDSSGKVYTWTSKPMETRYYTVERMSLAIDPDGRILIDAITGQPFDLQAFIADVIG